MMTHHEKLLIRLAIIIHEQLNVGQSKIANIELPTTTWQQSEVLLRQMRRAQQRGWQLADQRLQRDLQEMLHRLRGELIEIDHLLEPSRNEPRNASACEIYADLVALYEEFDEVSFDRRGRTLSVTIEPLELEGVYLGPFEIRLDWSNLADGHSHNYRVIALDANPAATNDSVTHPHVQHEAVCEGEGRQPIRQALEQGRLLDFFMIVANLLRTYNSDSPYVSLADWHGLECADCGTMVCDDQRWTCEKCETTVCGECYRNCFSCDGIFCSECVTCCEGCDEFHCEACMKLCSRCEVELCQGCLDNNERCSSCHDQESEETREELAGFREPNENCAAGAPLHAHRVGEAAIPA